MNRELKTDVLVVGAGPVGMFTALLLAEAGVEVTVIDRERRPTTHSYACGLHPRSIELFQRHGLLEPVQAAARRIDTIALYSGKGREATVSLAALPAPFPHLLVFPQSTLENLLVDRLDQLGCQVLWNHRLASLHPGDTRVAAHVDQLVGTAMGHIVPRWDWVVERTIDVSARFVVGADGHHSLVRRLLGITHERAADPEYYVVYEFVPETPLPDELALVLHQGASNVLWPLAGNRGRWSFQLADVKELTEFAEKDRQVAWSEPRSIGERTLQRCRERLASRAPWFRAGVKAVDWAVDIQFQHRLARGFGRGLCWLVGDAAHQTSPAGIQSMNVGLLEAEDLAGTLTRVLLENASPDVFQVYDRTHTREWRQLLGLEGLPQADAKTKTWVREHRARILRCLPAARTELTALLGQVGLTLPHQDPV